MTIPDERVRALGRSRWKIAITLTVFMIAMYFGFIALIAFAKPLLAILIVPGLTLGILLGVLVIVFSWLMTWYYVRWANAHYDTRVEELRR